MNYEKEIDRIIDKNFNKVNREGVGFLTTDMNRCKSELKDLVKNLTIPVVNYLLPHYFDASTDNDRFCKCGKYLTDDCHKRQL